MAFGLIAEAILRVEHKLDAILRHLRVPMPAPMHFTAGQLCPACGSQVDYVIDITHNVVVRRCNCKTGKVPSMFPIVALNPVTTEKPNASAARSPDAGEDGVPPEDGPQRRRR